MPESQVPLSDFVQPLPDDLREGNISVELQVPSWPPTVTQTLLRNCDARSSLTIRAKPSGRLRVELVRAGYPPVIVRTVHLRLHPPGLVRLNVAWRGGVAIVAAAGEIIGSSDEAIPDGVASVQAVEESAAPLDGAENDHALAERRHRITAVLEGRDVDRAQVHSWITSLGAATWSLSDLSKLVQEGHHHHLPGMVDALVRLVCGDGALLQWCAGILDVPLTVYAPSMPPQADSPANLLAGAFDVAAASGARHAFGIDIDVWLRHEQSWLTGRRVPVEALLLTIAATLTPRPDHVDSEDDRVLRASLRQSQVIASLCRFATTVCAMAASVVETATGTGPAAQGQASAEPGLYIPTA